MIATRNRRLSGVPAAVVIATLGFAATVSAPPSAKAAVFVGFGFGFPISFPAYYPPYPYPPPPPYYPPRYPAPGSYPPSTSYQPSSAYPPPGSTAPAPPKITYTPRPGWTNAQGEYCREYRATQGAGTRATQRYGTACRDFNGQWRIVN